MTMIPESLSFAILAGLSPLMGLYAAFLMGIVTAVLGGRRHGIRWSRSYHCSVDGSGSFSWCPVFACSSYIGWCISVTGGSFKLGKFVRLIPQPVMYGFLNGLAIIILWLRWLNLK